MGNFAKIVFGIPSEQWDCATPEFRAFAAKIAEILDLPVTIRNPSDDDLAMVGEIDTQTHEFTTVYSNGQGDLIGGSFSLGAQPCEITVE